MKKPAVLAAVMLGFLTAFVVGQIGITVVTPTPIPYRTVESRNLEPTVRAFYGAIDQLLANGDFSIRSKLAPDFVDHSLSDGMIRDGDSVIAGFEAIRALMPGMQFTVQSVQVDGDRATIELLGMPKDMALGTRWPITLPLPQPYREFLRIRRDRVVERWSQDDLWPRVDFSIPTAADTHTPTALTPAIQGFTLAPGSEGLLEAPGPVTLRVESGSLTVDRSSTDPRGYSYAAGSRIAAGETRILDAPGVLCIRNGSTERAELWTFSLQSLTLSAGAVDQMSGIQQVANIERELSLSSTPLEVAFARITLPVGAGVLTHHPAFMEEVAVLDGSLQGEDGSELASYLFARSRSSPLTASQIAAWGEGFSVGQGGAIAYRVSGDRPVTMLVLTIAPRTPDSTQSALAASAHPVPS